MLNRPRAITRQSRFAVLAPSSPSPLDRIQHAAHRLETGGATVILARNIDDESNRYLAGSDAARLEQVNDLFRREDIDAFLFARGGYGAMRILENLDYAALERNPRPIIGFSDITAVHQALAVRSGIRSFHGPMLNLDFHDGLSPAIEEWFWRLLEGDMPQWPIEASQVVLPGRAEGTLFGGCLSLITSLIGTPFDFWIDDGIWFWEDIDEPPYRIDRMLTHLRLAGRFRNLRGVVVGKLKNCGAGDDVDRLLRDFFSSRGIPVIRDFPFGHHGDNLLMPIGTMVSIDTGNLTFAIDEPAVSR